MRKGHRSTASEVLQYYCSIVGIIGVTIIIFVVSMRLPLLFPVFIYSVDNKGGDPCHQRMFRARWDGTVV